MTKLAKLIFKLFEIIFIYYHWAMDELILFITLFKNYFCEVFILSKDVDYLLSAD